MYLVLPTLRLRTFNWSSKHVKYNCIHNVTQIYVDWTSLVCPVNNIQLIRACKYTIMHIEPAKNGENGVSIEPPNKHSMHKGSVLIISRVYESKLLLL